MDRLVSTQADIFGTFRFNEVSLVPGDNVFTAFAQDPQGNASQVSRIIVRD